MAAARDGGSKGATTSDTLGLWVFPLMPNLWSIVADNDRAPRQGGAGVPGLVLR